MALVFVALIGKRNEPLYFFCKEELSEFMHLQMISFAALDILEDQKKRISVQSTNFDMHMGTLLLYDDYRVYGSYTNTHLKIIAIGDFLGPESTTIKDILASMSVAFANALQNPFQSTDKPLKSKRLDAAIQNIIVRHNNTISSKK